MKRKFLITLSALLVFVFAAAAFAYTRTQNNTQNMPANCPMMAQNAKETAGSKTDMSKVVIVRADDGDNCCQPGADCCKGGACCHKKK